MGRGVGDEPPLLKDQIRPDQNRDVEARKAAVHVAIIAEIAKLGYQATWDIQNPVEPCVAVLGELVPTDIRRVRRANGRPQKLSIVLGPTGVTKVAHLVEPQRRGFNVVMIAAEIVRRAQATADVSREADRMNQVEDLNEAMLEALTEDLRLPPGCSVQATTVPNCLEVAIKIMIEPLAARELLEHVIEIARCESSAEREHTDGDESEKAT